MIKALVNWSHFIHRVKFELRRIHRQGFPVVFLKTVARLISVALWLLLLPLTIILHLAGFRRVMVFTDRIGHLALEPDCLLKERALGLVRWRRWFILAPPRRVANRRLLNYWKPLIRIHESRAVCFVLESMSLWGFMRHDVSRYVLAINKAQAAYRIYALWGDRPPLLTITEADERWGAQALRQLGLPDGAWFVCVHVRERGFSPVDEELHAHRNGDIEAVLPAIREITSRGGWVIRIGDPTGKQLPPLPQVIDYAHHTLKSERLDIILCAKARFILGNTSGIALVGSAFGVPCALANMIPFPALGLGLNDISIPKLLWSGDLSRYLRYQEILDSPISSFIYAIQYRENGIRVVDNSAEDIRSLVVEMFQKLEGRDRNGKINETQSAEVVNKLKPHHYGYGSVATIGSCFIRKNKELFKGLVPE